MKFVGQLKKLDANYNATDSRDIDPSMFVSTILEKIKEMRIKLSQGNVEVLWKMGNYEEARVKLTNTQLNKLQSATKNKTGTTVRLTKKNFEC